MTSLVPCFSIFQNLVNFKVKGNSIRNVGWGRNCCIVAACSVIVTLWVPICNHVLGCARNCCIDWFNQQAVTDGIRNVVSNQSPALNWLEKRVTRVSNWRSCVCFGTQDIVRQVTRHCEPQWRFWHVLAVCPPYCSSTWSTNSELSPRLFCKSVLHTKIGHDVQANLGSLFGEAASFAQASALRIAIGIAKWTRGLCLQFLSIRELWTSTRFPNFQIAYSSALPCIFFGYGIASRARGSCRQNYDETKHVSLKLKRAISLQLPERKVAREPSSSSAPVEPPPPPSAVQVPQTPSQVPQKQAAFVSEVGQALR